MPCNAPAPTTTISALGLAGVAWRGRSPERLALPDAGRLVLPEAADSTPTPPLAAFKNLRRLTRVICDRPSLTHQDQIEGAVLQRFLHPAEAFDFSDEFYHAQEYSRDRIRVLRLNVSKMRPSCIVIRGVI